MIDKSTKVSRSEDTQLGVIDFGCGVGKSLDFAKSLNLGICIGIDKSEKNIATCRAKGLEVRLENIVNFSDKNVSAAATCVDVIPEIAGADFEKAITRIILASRNYSIFQHQYFDKDPEYAARSSFIPANFEKRIVNKPTLADYVSTIHRLCEPLNISGFAVTVFGTTSLVPLKFQRSLRANSENDKVPRNLRVIVGRKDKIRFHQALKQTSQGHTLYLWERP